MKAADRSRVVRSAIDIDWRSANRHKLELVRDGYKLVVDEQPEYIYNKSEDIVGVDAWVRLYGPDGNVVPIDPHRRIINPPNTPRKNVTVDGESREVIENPNAAFYEAVWDSVLGTPNPKGWRTRGTVTTVYADTTDGRVESQGATYSASRQGSDTILYNDTGSTFATGQFVSSTYSCYQQFFAFDTSAIEDDDEVTDVTFSLWVVDLSWDGDAAVTTWWIEAREYDWGTFLSEVRFRSGSTLSSYTLLASASTDDMFSSGSAYCDFTSETAFLTTARIKTGSVRLFTSSSRQRQALVPTGNEWTQFSHAETSGTTQDPKLTITHESSFSPAPNLFTSRPNRIWRRR